MLTSLSISHFTWLWRNVQVSPVKLIPEQQNPMHPPASAHLTTDKLKPSHHFARIVFEDIPTFVFAVRGKPMENRRPFWQSCTHSHTHETVRSISYPEQETRIELSVNPENPAHWGSFDIARGALVHLLSGSRTCFVWSSRVLRHSSRH